MIPSGFDYHAPATLPEAIALLREHRDGAKVLSGGQSLLPLLKLRLGAAAHLVDIGRIPGLEYVREERGALRIGACTRESALEDSELVRTRYPILHDTARVIADPIVRNRATVGGNLAHGDPGNDHPAIMLALGASFVLRGASGERVVAADGFFRGTYDLDLQPTEILTQIRVPTPAAGTGYCYAKLKRKTGDFATAAAAVLLRMKGDAVDDVRIALTNVAPTPLRASAAEAALRGRKLDDAAMAEGARLAMGICAPAADLRGDVEYKTAMAGEMTIRALATARTRAA